MKIVEYDPKTIDSMPAFLNKYIDEFKDEKYAMFVFKDIYEKAKDKEALSKKYEELLETMQIPYAFFPYYLHFNKVLHNMSDLQCPRMRTKTKDGFEFDIVQEPAYGMLVLNLEMLRSIEFKFDEKYKMSFYMQDLIQTCCDKGLYFSKVFFIDVRHSESYFNDEFDEGIMFDMNKFMEERKLYFESHSFANEKINDFVNELKRRFGNPAKPETKPEEGAESK